MLTSDEKRQLLEREMRELEARLFIRKLDVKKLERSRGIDDQARERELAVVRRDIMALEDAIGVVQEELDAIGQAE